MNHLEYYLDLTNNIVSCYDPDVEFFCIYQKEEDIWVKSNISFLQFSHDYEYKEITFDKAMTLCNDNIPYELYYEYLELLYKNGGIIKKRKINIIRKSSTEYKVENVDLYIDGVKYGSINDGEKVILILDFKDHMITCKTSLLNVKLYELHIPYGVDDYSLTLLFQNCEIIFI